ncbi:glutamine-hydrolyzing carbamoyl-phosphate synthase small subunit [Candidatus Micrarchaeota archaeon]|nr:glutamine-hydrolyzing carbamoyl-phosphate synthase small subunit [Candidatus Micrarchaeota archaeon]
MSSKAALVLSDGSIYYGTGFGAETVSVGEIVFSTSMTGYQEALTDPSYAGQILTLTYPLIGNYGINKEDFESRKIFVRGFVVREECNEPVHWKADKNIDKFLKEYDVPGIANVDTRAIVRKIRNFGVTPACLAVYENEVDVQELLEKAKALDYSSIDFVKEVAFEKEVRYGDFDDTIVLIDCGVKMNMIRELNSRGYSVVSVPPTARTKEILSYEPKGIVISNGPGDPALLGYVAKTARELMNRLPVFGICLGNQILAYAVGGKTYKMKFGHRSANQPVKELETGRVYITTQNHGFAVDGKSLPKDMEVTHINCNDNTIEGMRHKELPVFSIQYHPEAHPGPRDSTYMFDRFVENLKG